MDGIILILCKKQKSFSKLIEGVLAWIKTLPNSLGNLVDVLIIAVVFLTCFTLIVGIWLGFFITRKRMNHIVEIDFFPPRIIFKEKSSDK